MLQQQHSAWWTAGPRIVYVVRVVASHVLSVIVAFVAYSILDLAKAIQKIAFDKSRTNRLTGVLIWLAATASTTVSSLLLLYAVSLGSVLIVGAMGGSGLASLTIFSALVMKERTSRREVAGVVLILLGPVVMSLHSHPQADVVHVSRLLFFIGTVSAAYGVGIMCFRRRRAVLGLLIGGFAGALSGAVLLFQKVSTTGHGRSISWFSAVESHISSDFLRQVLEVLINPYALTWVLLSIASTLVLQFAYKYDRAIRIVPMFGANTILLPVVGGLLCFQEVLHPAQWAGVGVILVGVLLVSVPGSRRRTTAQ